MPAALRLGDWGKKVARDERREFAILLSLTHPQGELDVDATLEKMSPAQFEEWFSYYQRHPWGREWELQSMHAARTSNLMRLALCDTGFLSWDKRDAVPDKFLVPKWGKKKPPKANLLQGFAKMRAYIGV